MNDRASLDDVFSALAHPVRRAIISKLANGDATVNELAEPFEMSLPAVSRHIHVLRGAGLISLHKHAQFRRCRLEPSALHEASEWTEKYREIWAHRFDKMEAVLQTPGRESDGDGT